MNHKFLLCLFAFPIATISAMEKTPKNGTISSNKLERRNSVEAQKKNSPRPPQIPVSSAYYSHDELLQLQMQIKNGQVSPYAPF